MLPIAIGEIKVRWSGFVKSFIIYFQSQVLAVVKVLGLIIYKDYEVF